MQLLQAVPALRASATTNLIYDIGLWDGKDTAYYLSLGYNVLAIDANPEAVAKTSQRLRPFIESGRLTILNCGISSEAERQITFWVNETDPGSSSFDYTLASKLNNPCHPVVVDCVELGGIIEKYGTPHYMKIDIEGSDDCCLAALTPETAPQYLSFELFRANFDLDSIAQNLRYLGYRRFKFINQETHTTNTDVFSQEVFCRALRKVVTVSPFMKKVVQAIPRWLKPGKIDFEVSPAKLCDSGPFGEQSYGEWMSGDAMQQRAAWLFENHKTGKYGGWYDLHCAM